MSEPGYLDLSEQDRHQLVHEARRVADERFAPSIVAGLRPITRIRAELLRLGDEQGLAAFAEALTALEARAFVTDLVWDGSVLKFGVRAGLVTEAGSPLLFMKIGGRLCLDPRIDLPTLGLDHRWLSDVADVENLLRCDLYLTEQKRFVEWGQSSTFTVELAEVEDACLELPEDAARSSSY